MSVDPLSQSDTPTQSETAPQPDANDVSPSPAPTPSEELTSDPGSGMRWGTLALGAAAGALVVLVVLGILAATGLLGFGARPSPPSSAPEVNTPPRTPPQPELMPGNIAIGEHVPPGVYVGPELPAVIDVAPTDAPWLSGNTVIVAGPEGANLRPYPVADDNVAPASIGLAQGTQVQIISTFRLRMSDGDWWYVRVPGGDSPGPSFGWLREDLLRPQGT